VDIDEFGQTNRLTNTPITETHFWFFAAEVTGLRVYAVDNAGNMSAPGIWMP
jgi:hypothetical protein